MTRGSEEAPAAEGTGTFLLCLPMAERCAGSLCFGFHIQTGMILQGVSKMKTNPHTQYVQPLVLWSITNRGKRSPISLWHFTPSQAGQWRRGQWRKEVEKTENLPKWAPFTSCRRSKLQGPTNPSEFLGRATVLAENPGTYGWHRAFSPHMALPGTPPLSLT